MNTEEKLLTLMSLSRSRKRWRLLGIFLIIFVIFMGLKNNSASSMHPEAYIAGIAIDGMIDHNPEQLEKLNTLAQDDAVKAVYVTIDSPGGSMQPALDRYHALRRIAKQKPVVVSMGQMAASAGYLIAVAGDHIIAGESTLTGSVGVFLPLVDATPLSKKLGVTSRTIYSGEDKLATFPFNPVSADSEKYLQDLVNELHTLFIHYVQTRRNLPQETLSVVKTGRTFTGKKALEMGLIDALSHQENVKTWLNKTHNIPLHLPIIWQEEEEPFSLLEELGLPLNLKTWLPYVGAQARAPFTVQ